jgi:hypothetical protein
MGAKDVVSLLPALHSLWTDTRESVRIRTGLRARFLGYAEFFMV